MAINLKTENASNLTDVIQYITSGDICLLRHFFYVYSDYQNASEKVFRSLCKVVDHVVQFY
jgi:hypothetical protein